jgi:hypothetical protein
MNGSKDAPEHLPDLAVLLLELLFATLRLFVLVLIV